jgi:hypothetical protein
MSTDAAPDACSPGSSRSALGGVPSAALPSLSTTENWRQSGSNKADTKLASQCAEWDALV